MYIILYDDFQKDTHSLSKIKSAKDIFALNTKGGEHSNHLEVKMLDFHLSMSIED